MRKLSIILTVLCIGFVVDSEFLQSIPFSTFRLECPKEHGLVDMSMQIVESMGFRRRDVLFTLMCARIDDIFPPRALNWRRFEREDCYWSQLFDPIVVADTEDSCRRREYLAGVSRIASTAIQVLCCRLRTRKEGACMERTFSKPSPRNRAEKIHFNSSLISSMTIQGGFFKVRFCQLVQRSFAEIQNDVPITSTTTTVTTPATTTFTTTASSTKARTTPTIIWTTRRTRPTIRTTRRPKKIIRVTRPSIVFRFRPGQRLSTVSLPAIGPPGIHSSTPPRNSNHNNAIIRLEGSEASHHRQGDNNNIQAIFQNRRNFDSTRNSSPDVESFTSLNTRPTPLSGSAITRNRLESHTTFLLQEKNLPLPPGWVIFEGFPGLPIENLNKMEFPKFEEDKKVKPGMDYVEMDVENEPETQKILTIDDPFVEPVNEIKVVESKNVPQFSKNNAQRTNFDDVIVDEPKLEDTKLSSKISRFNAKGEKNIIVFENSLKIRDNQHQMKIRPDRFRFPTPPPPPIRSRLDFNEISSIRKKGMLAPQIQSSTVAVNTVHPVTLSSYQIPTTITPKNILTFCTKEIAIKDSNEMVIACGIEHEIWQPYRCPSGTDCFHVNDSNYRICCTVSKG